MGKYARRKTGEMIRLRKSLKSPISKVAQVMPKGFTDEDFLSLFKTAYPGSWREMENYYHSSQDEYKNRIHKGLDVVRPIPPKKLILSLGKHSLSQARNNMKSSAEEERIKEKERTKMIRKGESKLAEIQQNSKKRERKFQNATPRYVNELINRYFTERKRNALNVDIRYVIILECAKFKCPQTTQFLQKVNACEKNDELRLLAYKSLERFGLSPRLAHKRKGRKRLTMTTEHKIEEDPSSLLGLIYDNQHLIHKNFDLFLSHSYGRQKELLEAKDFLNRNGLVVYVDWINDAEMLQREKQNEDTFKVLFERLKQSSALLFIQTKLSVKSPYCIKEIEFFKQFNRPMFIYEAEPVEDRPAILEELIPVKIERKKFILSNNEESRVLNFKLIDNYNKRGQID